MKRDPRAANPTKAIISQRDEEQAAVAQAEVLEAMKRLVRDGFDWRCVLAGAGAAMADMVGKIAGPEKVPAHFAQLSALTATFTGGQTR